MTEQVVPRQKNKYSRLLKDFKDLTVVWYTKSY